MIVQFVVTADVPHIGHIKQVKADLMHDQYVTSAIQKSASLIDGSNRRVVAVDFDGTLCDSDYPNCGPVKEGAKEALHALRNLGFTILIYSCRSSHWHYDQFGVSPDAPTLERDTVNRMSAWLVANQIPFDEIDDGTRGKPLADYYIDDRGVRFNNNWPEIAEFVALKEQFGKLFN